MYTKSKEELIDEAYEVREQAEDDFQEALEIYIEARVAYEAALKRYSWM